MLNDFIAYLEQEVANHSIYVIGGQGQRGKAVTEKWIRSRESESKTNADRAVAFWALQVVAGYGEVLGAFDCSGLGMYWLQNLKGVYKNDMTANGMMGKCRKLEKSELKRGDWTFIVNDAGRAVHIGYIADDGLNVIEARGRDYGVIKSPLSSRWNRFGRPEVFAAEIEGGETGMNITKNLRKGDKGEEVKTLQQALLAKGYDLGKFGADGSFGAATEAAVKAFQTAASLKADGIAGKNTVTALGLILGDSAPDYQALYEKLKTEAAAQGAELVKLQAAYEELAADMRKVKLVAERY